MSIADKLTDLANDLRNCRTAITNKGGTINATAGFAEVAEQIALLPTGSNVGTVVDNSTALIKTVPKNSISHCYINAIGGMTYKCNQLIPFPYKETSKTMNGVTFTVATDGMITANGTATELAYVQLANNLPLPKGKYFLSGAPSNTNFILSLYKGSNWVTEFADRGSGIAIDTSTYDYDSVIISCFVYAGKTVNNAVFKPMLNEGTTALPYELYFEGLRDAKTTALKVSGANLFDINNAEFGVNYTEVLINNGVLRVTNKVALESGWLNCNTKINATCKGVSTLHYSAKVLVSGVTKSAILPAVINKDGTYKTLTATYFTDVDTTVSGTATIPEEYRTDEWSPYILFYGVAGVSCEKDSYVEYSDIMVSFSTGEYKPYHEPITYPLPDEILALTDGKGVFERNGRDIFSNTIDFENGKISKKCYTDVYTGEEDWIAYTNKECTYFIRLGFEMKSGISTEYGNMYSMGEEVTGMYPYATASLYITDFRYATLEEFKAHLAELAANGTPLTVTYAVAEPTETDLPVGFSPLLPVEEGGTIEFVNEYNYAVPSKVTYQTVVGG